MRIDRALWRIDYVVTVQYSYSVYHGTSSI